jgi:hypothetical protein
MKELRFAATLYAAILLVLLLFPPWSEWPVERRFSYLSDAAHSSLGHHWRFSLPSHWGYQEDDCADGNGHLIGCNGKSVWEVDSRAVVDFRMLQYESILGLIFSALLALIIDPMRKVLARPALFFRGLVSKITNRRRV